MNRFWVIPIVMLAASCGGGQQQADTSDAAGGGLIVHVSMSPTCPAQSPSAPAAICRPRPVRGAKLHVGELTLTTDRTGRAGATLHAGRYTLTADPVGSYDGAPRPVTFTVRVGETTKLRLAYDSGIR